MMRVSWCAGRAWIPIVPSSSMRRASAAVAHIVNQNFAARRAVASEFSPVSGAAAAKLSSRLRPHHDPDHKSKHTTHITLLIFHRKTQGEDSSDKFIIGENPILWNNTVPARILMNATG